MAAAQRAPSSLRRAVRPRRRSQPRLHDRSASRARTRHREAQEARASQRRRRRGRRGCRRHRHGRAARPAARRIGLLYQHDGHRGGRGARRSGAGPTRSHRDRWLDKVHPARRACSSSSGSGAATMKWRRDSRHEHSLSRSERASELEVYPYVMAVLAYLSTIQSRVEEERSRGSGAVVGRWPGV